MMLKRLFSTKQSIRSNPRVCMIVFSYYPADPRVRREAEALIDAGYEVDVICLQQEGQKAVDSVYQVRIYRQPIQRKRGRKYQYLLEYLGFILRSMFKAATLHFRRKYQIVHVHNMPDILAYSALIPKLTGARVILDLHDPMPEVFMTKYNTNHSHPIIKALVALERLSISFANFVFTPNLAFKDLFTSRSCAACKIDVVMNSPDEKIFNTRLTPPKKYLHSPAFVMMYHGTIVERHGLGTALEAMALSEPYPALNFMYTVKGIMSNHFSVLWMNWVFSPAYDIMALSAWRISQQLCPRRTWESSPT